MFRRFTFIICDGEATKSEGKAVASIEMFRCASEEFRIERLQASERRQWACSRQFVHNISTFRLQHFESVKVSVIRREVPRVRSSSGGLEAEEKLEALLPRLVRIHDHIMLKFHHS